MIKRFFKWLLTPYKVESKKPVNNGTRWSEEELSMVMTSGLSNDELALMLGRTECSVATKKSLIRRQMREDEERL